MLSHIGNYVPPHLRSRDKDTTQNASDARVGDRQGYDQNDVRSRQSGEYRSSNDARRGYDRSRGYDRREFEGHDRRGSDYGHGGYARRGSRQNVDRDSFDSPDRRGSHYSDKRGSEHDRRGSSHSRQNSDSDRYGSDHNRCSLDYDGRTYSFERQGRGMEYDKNGPDYGRRSSDCDRRGVDYDRRGSDYDRRGSDYDRRGSDYNRRGLYDRRGSNYDRRSDYDRRGSDFDRHGLDDDKQLETTRINKQQPSTSGFEKEKYLQGSQKVETEQQSVFATKPAGHEGDRGNARLSRVSEDQSHKGKSANVSVNDRWARLDDDQDRRYSGSGYGSTFGVPGRYPYEKRNSAPLFGRNSHSPYGRSNSDAGKGVYLQTHGRGPSSQWDSMEWSKPLSRNDRLEK